VAPPQIRLVWTQLSCVSFVRGRGVPWLAYIPFVLWFGVVVVPFRCSPFLPVPPAAAAALEGGFWNSLSWKEQFAVLAGALQLWRVCLCFAMLQSWRTKRPFCSHEEP